MKRFGLIDDLQEGIQMTYEKFKVFQGILERLKKEDDIRQQNAIVRAFGPADNEGGVGD